MVLISNWKLGIGMVGVKDGVKNCITINIQNGKPIVTFVLD